MLTLDSDSTGDTNAAGKRRRRITAPAALSRTADPSDALSRAERIEQVELAALRGYERNARVHSPKQVIQLAASIREFGFVNPVIADAGNVVVAGHGRLAAAWELGLAAVPVIRLEHLTPQQVRAYRIADNRLAELSGWDEELLALELQDLAGLELDVEIGLEVLGPDGAIVRAEQPALGEAEDEMDRRQPQHRVAQPAVRLIGWWS